ncbi:hypothetical protein P152DRAFT_459971 [Eremomyces bilateralis CBS 781.70]|uniref:Uncharacterized protein n=1 Tax=Eremomyces bilateralis CBS 781.70 TaxID=1392243 RepID=A0A6G1FZI0_9PEZI|nr:uncharacterized protein P152DRAFT_459971 [Eremomyces bilateralis CBS 781.70]KAF1811091.1 hypothetical protein P152DRAFT_459971 [Eremomyces bilateralis CBS 781.70]
MSRTTSTSTSTSTSNSTSTSISKTALGSAPMPTTASQTWASALPPPTFQFKGISDLNKLLISDSTPEFFTIENVSTQDFAGIELAREKCRIQKFRLTLYSADSKCLFITIPTGPHERLHGHLDDGIFREIVGMGLTHDLIRAGATIYQKWNSTGGTESAGEGDSARIPLSTRPLPSNFPTLVIEAGFSQSLSSLRQKAKWWFDVSGGDIKIVILAKLDQQSQIIHLEKWKAIQLPPSAGVTTRTRAATAAAAPQSHCVQTIDISRTPGINDTDPNRFDGASYVITGGPLQLEFMDLFLRKPIPPEADVVFSEEFLQEYAGIVWRAV